MLVTILRWVCDSVTIVLHWWMVCVFVVSRMIRHNNSWMQNSLLLILQSMECDIGPNTIRGKVMSEFPLA